MQQQKQLTNSQTQFMDKLEVFFITLISTFIVALLMLTTYDLGINNMKKEAVERNFAHYDVRSNGKTEFRWNNSAQ